MVTFGGHFKIIYGEIAFNLPTEPIGFQVGIDGILAGFSYDGRNIKAEHLNIDDFTLNIGASDIFGLDYEREFNIDGTFGKEEFAFTITDYGKLVDSHQSQYSSLKIGLPDIKVAGGVGISFGSYISLNSKKYELSPFEKQLQEAFNKTSSNVNKLVPDLQN